MQIGALVRRAAVHHGALPCLTEGGRTLTYAEFDAATDRLGNALLARGLQPGDRVGVLLPNSIECIIAYYALAKSGLVRVGMNTRETLGDHNYKLTDSGARAVLHKGQDGLCPDIQIDWDEICAMIDTGDRAPCKVDRPLDAPYRLGYTGGTTGSPKAVTLTTRGELAELSAFLTDLVPGIRCGDTFLHAAPIAHASGAFFLPALVRGARSLVMTRFDAGDFIRLAEAEKATMTFLVPTMLAMLLEEPSLADADLRFQTIAYGASPIAEDVLRRAQETFKGADFVQVYGLTETAGGATNLPPEAHDPAKGKLRSCGIPNPGMEVRVVDDKGEEVPVGDVGEIVIRGGSIMKGYWNRADATKDAIRNGWFYTGDAGYFDKDGFLFIHDRVKDMIVSGGENIYPREVEEILYRCPGVQEVAVVGLADEKWGQAVTAFVVRSDPALSPQALDAFCKASEDLAPYKRPRRYEFLESLPLNPSGKVLRRELVARHAPQQAA